MALTLTEVYGIDNSSVRDAPETTISEGILRGLTIRTDSGRPISAFLGVPYAQPPVGHLRSVLYGILFY